MKKKNLMFELLKLMGATLVGWLLWVLIFSATTPVEVETMVEPFTGASMIFGLITAVVVLLIIELNSINLLKQRVGQTLHNISIANKRAATLLDKANKVTEKYMAFESHVVVEIASTLKPEPNSSRKIKNSSAFEQRINAFPELKSNQSVMELLKQLRESENAVANFKLEHNDVVAQYNYSIHALPISLFSGLLNMKEVHFYNDESDLISDEALGLI